MGRRALPDNALINREGLYLLDVSISSTEREFPRILANGGGSRGCKLSMDMAPAAAEGAVVTGAVVEAACMQQYAAAVAWVWQQAACVCAAAGGGGRGNDCNGWQAASMRATVGARC